MIDWSKGGEIMNEETRAHQSIYLSPTITEAIKVEAEMDKRTFSAMAEILLDEAIESRIKKRKEK